MPIVGIHYSISLSMRADCAEKYKLRPTNIYIYCIYTYLLSIGRPTDFIKRGGGGWDLSRVVKSITNMASMLYSGWMII